MSRGRPHLRRQEQQHARRAGMAKPGHERGQECASEGLQVGGDSMPVSVPHGVVAVVVQISRLRPKPTNGLSSSDSRNTPPKLRPLEVATAPARTEEMSQPRMISILPLVLL